MVETKRKVRDEGNLGRDKSKKKTKKQKSSVSKLQARKKRGPRLPSSLQKELERLNPSTKLDSDEEIASDDDNQDRELLGKDLYEYEEQQAEEESMKNKRYDPVQVHKSEYELPDKLSKEFKDEYLESDDEDEDNDDNYNWGKRNQKVSSDDSEDEDDERHARMLKGIIRMPDETFEERKKKRGDAVVQELYPESEYNPSRDIVDGDGRISIEDLLNPLREKSGYSELRRRMQQMEKKARPIHAPLPRADQAKLERKAASEWSNKDITKWEPIIKRNREAPSINFDEKVDLEFSTVGALASEFEPRTEFERKIAALVHDDKLMEAHKKDGSRLLELNEVSIEDEKDRQSRIAKMRSLLFRHEMKAKHVKKIKSKTYHRLLKKDKLKAASSQMEMDPEAAKEYAMKQERRRAEERMTLRHRNQNRWARRILERGLNAQDDGTRAALAEQLQRHAALSRKMNSVKDSSSSSSSDDASDEDDADGSDQDRALLAKAKRKTLEVLEEEDAVPKSGLLSLPFMRRGLEKSKEASAAEVKLALEEYDSTLKTLDNVDGLEDPEVATVSGRRVFGTAKAQILDASNKVKSDKFYGNTDSEDDSEARENGDMVNSRSNDLQRDANSDSVVILEDTDTHRESIFKNFNDIVRDSGAKTTYEVAMFVSDTWKKAKNKNEEDTKLKKAPELVGPVKQERKETDVGFEDDSDTDSEGHVVDGVLSSGPKLPYELPSQEDLIRQAFAADDVEDDFEKNKLEVLNEENPEPEKPLLLPGWGQWTDIQQKKGPPAWMLKEHENAKRKREEALKKRKDAHLRHVIISEKLDKKAEKLHTKALPYPFTSKEVFEQSIRVPIGPESNPATAIGALNRPEVVKRPGVIINPIAFEEVNPHERTEERRGGKHKLKENKGNVGKSKTMRNTKAGGKS
ncbi:hypothetical protein L6164_010233 [Bauhinia variegata]|uniref:Uncharacterized protein n=1 Tax=Bauhinia variegata TaxID=167791 RepID=A0ACB9PMM8_BAUVA|nr:hypothetical protein L6164_010233 [Bauhinia variegata]